MEDRNYIMIDGVRYHADRPADCRFCQFWKNRRRGCILGRENCYYLAQVVITEEERKCEGCRYAVGTPCVSACCYKDLERDLWKQRGGRTVMGKKTGDIRRAEKLIQKKERQTKKAKRPACCGSCEYNQPNFKYRTCLFVRCPMDKTRRTLRDKPLRKDKFSA